MDGLHPKDAMESDADSDSDSDTDSDTDTDTDTDTMPVRKPSWSWGATNTFDNADASFVGVNGGYDLLSAGDLDGDGYAEIGMGIGDDYAIVASGARPWALDMASDDLPVLRVPQPALGWVLRLGDVNGDGRGDLALPDQSLLLGPADLWSKTELVADVFVDDSLSWFTTSRVEDMDGDGTNEWMLVSNSSLHNGEANIFDADAINGAKGTLDVPDDSMWTLYGSGGGPTYYYAAGDATGDGLSDMYGGTPGWPEVWLVEGGWNPPKGTPIADAALVTIYSLCGGLPSSLRTPGDLDDDGVAELSLSTSGGCDDGMHIFHGGDDMIGSLAISDASSVLLAKDVVGGGVLEGMGDIDGDGWTDLGFWPKGIILGSGALPAAITADDVDIWGGFPEVAGFPSYLWSVRRDDGTLADIDGDGLGDLFSWARYYDESDEYAGVVRVALGRTEWPASVTDEEVDAMFFFGSDDDLNTILVTNIDGDDYDDVVMSSQADGAVYFFFGQP